MSNSIMRVHTSLLVCLAAVVITTVSAEIPSEDSIVIGSLRFATLDAMNPQSNSKLCQDQPLAIPDGWSIANSTTTEAQAAVASGTWGTTCLAFVDGKAFYAKYLLSCGVATIAEDDGLYSPSCDVVPTRILIVSDADGAEDQSISPIAGLTGSALDDVSFVFNGVRYASLDGTTPDSDSFGCQTIAMRVPDGWEIMSDNDGSRIAMAGPGNSFGTACYVTEFGISRYTNKPQTLCGQDSLAFAGASDRYYSVRDCSRRVFITQPSDAADSWNASPTIPSSAIFQGHGYEYATIDAHDPDDAVASCQTTAFTMPDGWELAEHNSKSIDVIMKKFFGTNCLVMADGNSYGHGGSACLQNQLKTIDDSEGLTYYSLTHCDQRILLQREAPAPGVCTSWGDPHITSFDGTSFDFFGVGDYVLAESLDGTVAVHSRHFVTGRASSNQAVGVFLEGTHITIETASGTTLPTVKVDGVDAAFVDSTAAASGSGVTITTTGELLSDDGGSTADQAETILKYTIATPNSRTSVVVGTEVSMFDVQYLHIWVHIDPAHLHTTKGLCGVWDYDGSNDFSGSPSLDQTGNGPTPQEIHDWGLQWELPDADSSYLPYGDGEGPSDHQSPDDWSPVYDFNDLDFEEQDAAIDACHSRNLLDDFYLQCLNDVAITGDTSVAAQAVTAQYQSVLETFGGDTCSTKTAPDVTNIFVSNGRRYALLVEDPVNEALSDCSQSYVKIPDGWQVADDKPYTRAAIACSDFQSVPCVVLRNGKSIDPTTMGPCSEQTAIRFRGPALDCVETVNVCGRVLIMQDDDLVYPITFGNPDFESVSGQALDNWSYYELGVAEPGVTYEVSADGEGRGNEGTAIKMTSAADGDQNGAQQAIAINQLQPEAFRIGVWSKSEDVTGIPDDHYALHFDLNHGGGVFTYGITARFNVGTHGWEYMAVDVVPAFAIQEIFVFLLFRNEHTGTVYFDDLTIEAVAGNVLPNPSFDILSQESNSASSFWFDFNQGFTTTSQAAGYHRYAIKVEVDTEDATQQKAGAIQVVSGSRVPVADGEAVTLYFGGWSKAENVGGSFDPFYSIYLDVFFEDGTALYAKTANFRVGTHDWEFAHGFVTVDKPIKDMNVVAMFQGRTGTAYFDELFLTILDCTKMVESGQTYGDPHMVTLDGATYDLQTIAEFTLLKDLDSDWELQARHSEAGAAAVNSASAVHCSGHTVSIYRGMAENFPSVYVDGVRRVFETKVMFPSSLQPAGSIIRNGDLLDLQNPNLKYTISCFENGHIVEIHIAESSFSTQYMLISPLLPPSAKGRVTGLLGNWNGDPLDDVVDDNGESLGSPSSLSHSDLYSKFAYRFQVDETNTLFTYKVGFDHNSVINLEHYAEDPLTTATALELAIAGEFCTRANLATDAYNACLLDYLATGDVAFVASMHSVSNAAANPAFIDDVEQVQIEGSIELPVKTPPVLVDECEEDLHDCDVSALCVDTVLSYTCTCAVGYAGTGDMCEDIDECSLDHDVCQEGAECVNEIGSYWCVCDGGACEDVDECFAGTDECAGVAYCFNIAGGYLCQCPAGYSGNGFECSDIDECQSQSHNCDSDTLCVNTPGSYMCGSSGLNAGAPVDGGTSTLVPVDGTCEKGYTLVDDVCVDNDECESGLNLCDTRNGVDCQNLPGTYACTCGATGTSYDPSAGLVRCNGDYGTGVSGTFVVGESMANKPLLVLLAGAAIVFFLAN